jgi:hypothetical protein
MVLYRVCSYGMIHVSIGMRQFEVSPLCYER